MSFELKTKKKIPSEHETKTNILSIAHNIGCYEEANRIYAYHERAFEKNGGLMASSQTKQQIAESLIMSLAKLNENLVTWLLNEDGEIVVGGVPILKFELNDENL